jgi:hypothetical protein
MALPRKNEIVLDKMQAGKEVLASRGVAVAATRVLDARGVLSFNRPLAALPSQSGSFSPRRTPVYGRQTAGLTLTAGLGYEDAPFYFDGALKGYISGVSDAGTPNPAYEYEYVPTEAADDLASYTFEVGDPDNIYELAQVMFNSWTIRMDGDSTDEPGWMFEAEAIARALDTSSFTAALTLPAREAVMAPGTLVYIDDAGGTLGTTQVTGQIINFSVTGNSNVHLKGFLEDESEYGAGNVGRGERVFDAQLTVEFFDDTEFANYRGNGTGEAVQRLIRVKREGSTAIHTTVFPSIELDIAGYWSSWSPGDREGNKIATFGLMGFVDDVLGYDFAARVVNDLATANV